MIQSSKNKYLNQQGGIISLVILLISACLIALLIVTFVFRSYQVDGISMENTLQNNNMLIVWKLPRTWSMITGHQYVPKRGNIIVFNESNLLGCGQAGTKQLIKRVIGLPGDTVTIKNGHYFIYNKKHPHGFDPGITLGFNKNFPPTYGSTHITLGAHQIFVSGDNRPNSCDSRIFGPINTNQIVGQLILRFYPFNEIKVF